MDQEHIEKIIAALHVDVEELCQYDRPVSVLIDRIHKLGPNGQASEDTHRYATGIVMGAHVMVIALILGQKHDDPDLLIKLMDDVRALDQEQSEASRAMFEKMDRGGRTDS